MPEIIEEKKIKENKAKHFDHLSPWLATIETKAFLSSDFLLWLWFFTESTKNPINLRTKRNSPASTVKLWIENRIVLESSGSKAHVQTLRGGEPSSSIEAGSALVSGKSVKELKLGCHLENFGDFTILFSSKDLTPKSINIPNPPDGHFSLAHRLKATEVILEIFDSFFKIFLEQRISEIWDQETWPAIDAWIDTRGHKEAHLH